MRISDLSSDVCSSDLRSRLAGAGLGPGRGATIHARGPGRAHQYAQRIPARLMPIRRMGRAKGETHRFRGGGSGRGMMGFAALYPSYGLPLGKSQKKAPGRTRGLIHPVVADQSAWTTLVPAIRSWPQRRSLRKISNTSTIWINAPMSGR